MRKTFLLAALAAVFLCQPHEAFATDGNLACVTKGGAIQRCPATTAGAPLVGSSTATFGYANAVTTGIQVGALTATGSTAIGDSATDAITMQGAIAISAGTVALPAAYAPLEKDYTVHIGHADITEADGSEVETLAGFPTNVVIKGAALELNTAFSGGSANAVTIKCGVNGDDDSLFGALSVFTGVAAGWVGPTVPAPAAANTIGSFQSAYAPICTVATTAANGADLTAGDAVIHIIYTPLALHD